VTGSDASSKAVLVVQFERFKEMQRALELDRAAWDEQLKTTGRRESPAAASFTLGSMIGGVASAIRNVRGSAQPSQSGQYDKTSTHSQQQEEQDVAVVAEEEKDVPVCPNTVPRPVRFNPVRPVRHTPRCPGRMSHKCCIGCLESELNGGC
jgi:hypothetical protein